MTKHSRSRSGRSTRAVGVIVLGDLLAIVGFVGYGLTTHGMHPLQFPRHTIITSIPFVLAWILLAPPSGLYRSETIRSARSTLVRTTAVWLGVSVLGSWIRSTSHFPGGAPSEFVLVMIVFGLCVVLPWRGIIALTEHVRHNHHGRTGKTGQA